MTVDYDAPRRTQAEPEDESLEDLAGRRKDTATAVIDVDEADAADSFELPGADLSDEELTVRVIPSRLTSSPAPAAFWSTTEAGWPTRRA